MLGDIPGLGRTCYLTDTRLDELTVDLPIERQFRLADGGILLIHEFRFNYQLILNRTFTRYLLDVRVDACICCGERRVRTSRPDVWCIKVVQTDRIGLAITVTEVVMNTYDTITIMNSHERRIKRAVLGDLTVVIPCRTAVTYVVMLNERVFITRIYRQLQYVDGVNLLLCVIGPNGIYIGLRGGRRIGLASPGDRVAVTDRLDPGALRTLRSGCFYGNV